MSIQEIAFEDVVCKMASILSRPQSVKSHGRDKIMPRSSHLHNGIFCGNTNIAPYLYLSSHLGPLLLPWINFNPSMDK